MKRRNFLGMLGGGALGLIFVPKYERWFRPNRILQPVPQGIHMVPWPESQPGDVLLLVTQSTNQIADPPFGWTLHGREESAGRHLAVSWKIAEARPRDDVAVHAQGPCVSKVFAFRGASGVEAVPQTTAQTGLVRVA